MNLALITSYIIAAMLILSIIMVNLRVSSSSAELTLTQITRENVVNVTDMINDDLPNMGYNVDSKLDTILTYADSLKISFYRNIQNDADRSPELVTWEFKGDEELPATKNPNDRLLVRKVFDPNNGTEDVTEIRTGVTRFNLRYYNKHGESLGNNIPPPGSGSSLENVKQIYLELEMQSAEPIIKNPSASDRYIRSVYEKRFTPRNIE